MRVLVTGSRQMEDQGRVYHELDALYAHAIEQGHAEFTVVHGGAPGADSLAGQWVFDRRMNGPVHPQLEVHPAEWNRYGRALAGGIRNAKMVGLGADIVVAFFQPGAENRGTRNCSAQARLAGLEVKETWE